MADLSAVEKALVALVAGVLFPSGGYVSGTMAQAFTGHHVNVYRGWPTSKQLADDFRASRSHVSVYSEPGMVRDVSRYPADALQVATVAATLTATVSGATVTLGGSVTPGNVVAVQVGSPAGVCAYAAQAGDTLATVAAVLAAKIDGATSTGPAITLPSRVNAAARTMAPQPVLTMLRQQIQGFRIIVWAPSPSVRDALCNAIDGGISAIKNSKGFLTKFFAVGTYEQARIQYRSSYSSDSGSRDGSWRRDLCYSVEYPTTLLELDPIMLFGGGPLWVSESLTQFDAMQPSDALIATEGGDFVFIDAANNLVGSQPL